MTTFPRFVSLVFVFSVCIWALPGNSQEPAVSKVNSACPCAGPSAGRAWKNHGEYVSCVTKAAKQHVSDAEKNQVGQIVSNAAKSSCGGSEIGKLVNYPGPPPVDPELLDKLPKDPDTGLPVLAENSGVKILVDMEQKDAISGLGACTHWITSCLNPEEGRTLDDCARSVPRCTTNQPWLENTVCCPVACFQQYSEMRHDGIEPIDAFSNVYGREGSCFPGYRELLD